jgi:hypothetical protein
MHRMVAIGISDLERCQEFSRGLVRVGLQTLKHFAPVRFKRIRATTSARFGRLSVLQGPDLDSSSPGVFTPKSNTITEGHKLTAMPAAGILGA